MVRKSERPVHIHCRKAKKNDDTDDTVDDVAQTKGCFNKTSKDLISLSLDLCVNRTLFSKSTGLSPMMVVIKK